jgi:hypothetical protein
LLGKISAKLRPFVLAFCFTPCSMNWLLVDLLRFPPVMARGPTHFAPFWSVFSQATIVFFFGGGAFCFPPLCSRHYHYRCRHNQSDVLKVLLAHGAGVDAQNQFGETALHTCCLYGSADCIPVRETSWNLILVSFQTRKAVLETT